MNRDLWYETAKKIVIPVLHNADAMPVVQHPNAGREASSKYEAISRVLAGISPWLAEDTYFMDRAVYCLDSNKFGTVYSNQALIDYGYIAQAFLQCPELTERVHPNTLQDIMQGMFVTRKILPIANNWLLMAALIECFRFKLMGVGDPMRIDYALRSIDQWYKGDGVYGDGVFLQNDYYNSIVIHPALHTLRANLLGVNREWDTILNKFPARTARYTQVLERQISPEGTYPVVGRSALYKLGCFHALSHSLAYGYYEGDKHAAQSAMTAVLKRQLPSLFDGEWLALGFGSENLELAEPYVSTGSLYAFCLAFPMLRVQDIWDDVPWTQKRIWAGEPVNRDTSIDYN